jgi:N-carbamoylputrescine amidase
MRRRITVAAVQMDARLAPTDERLQRAERLVKQAAQAGAQLVILPEIFNTGYGYTDENFRRAEPLSGPTVKWLRATAAQLRIHLAGSLLLREGGEIYNALLLFAPDGRMWRYDKSYPWGWERGYFRGRRGTTVARTALGDFGMMICWDVAHPRLWREYAGRVDLMIVSSCPPDITNATFVFPQGERIAFGELGRIGASLADSGPRLFGEMVNQQTAWLGVPTVQTVGTGHLQTAIPRGRLSLLTYVPIAPRLLRYLPQAHRLRMESDFIPGCKVVDGSGRVLAALEQAEGEHFTLAEVELAEEKPRPKRPQPPTLLSPPAYLASDLLLPALMRSVYRRGTRRHSRMQQEA